MRNPERAKPIELLVPVPSKTSAVTVPPGELAAVAVANILSRHEYDDTGDLQNVSVDQRRKTFGVKTLFELEAPIRHARMLAEKEEAERLRDAQRKAEQSAAAARLIKHRRKKEFVQIAATFRKYPELNFLLNPAQLTIAINSFTSELKSKLKEPDRKAILEIIEGMRIILAEKQAEVA